MNAESQNIHATCVSVNGTGVLLLGKSGAGKSDLALRLIGAQKALLVADDRVDLFVHENVLIATAPEILRGLLEVRGVGICRVPYVKEAPVKLVVELAAHENIERLPQEAFYNFNGVTVPLIKVYPFEASAGDKIVIKLKAILDLV